MRLFSTNPSATTEQWYVWDIYEPLPPKPVFFGTMEEAGLVADSLNAREPLGDAGHQ
jgi:hypothetical protein